MICRKIARIGENVKVAFRWWFSLCGKGGGLCKILAKQLRFFLKYDILIEKRKRNLRVL
jgi:hypothetical protein